MRQIKILFLAGNPEGTDKLALDEEARMIEGKLRGARYRDFLGLRTCWAVRPDDIIQALNEDKPHIVHFSCHGAQAGGLVLLDENGAPRVLSGDKLSRLFEAIPGNISVVMLNACFSALTAKAITRTVDIVIGMEGPIEDRAAGIFAASFYRGLAFGATVKSAFDQGILAVALETDSVVDEQAPRLCAKDGVDPGSLVLVGEEASLLRFASNESSEVMANRRTWTRVGDRDEIRRDLIDVVSAQRGRDFLEKDIHGIARTRGWENLVVALFDVDNLTQINRRHGHLVGTRVLAAVGKVLRNRSRRGWFIGRCGDDTFYAVLPKLRFEDGLPICEDIIARIEGEDWGGLAPDLHVTCSCGLAAMSGNESPRSTAVRAALGFRKAKKLGGNRVEAGPGALPKGASLDFS